MLWTKDNMPQRLFCFLKVWNGVHVHSLIYIWWTNIYFRYNLRVWPKFQITMFILKYRYLFSFVIMFLFQQTLFNHCCYFFPFYINILKVLLFIKNLMNLFLDKRVAGMHGKKHWIWESHSPFRGIFQYFLCKQFWKWVNFQFLTKFMGNGAFSSLGGKRL